MKIYVVIGRIEDYDYSEHWLVKAFQDERKAIKYASDCSVIAIRHRDKAQKAEDVFSYQNKAKSELDCNFQMYSSVPTRYYVEETTLD